MAERNDGQSTGIASESSLLKEYELKIGYVMKISDRFWQLIVGYSALQAASFAGFKEENLRINVKERKLTLSAEALNKKIHKSLNLPKKVLSETVNTKCKNGVLEIRLKKNLN